MCIHESLHKQLGSVTFKFLNAKLNNSSFIIFFTWNKLIHVKFSFYSLAYDYILILSYYLFLNNCIFLSKYLLNYNIICLAFRNWLKTRSTRTSEAQLFKNHFCSCNHQWNGFLIHSRWQNRKEQPTEIWTKWLNVPRVSE